MMSKPLFYLGHPAHYHLFKGVINHFHQSGNRPVVIIKKKDILEDLIRKEPWKVIVLRSNPRGSSFKVRIRNVVRLLALFLISLRTRSNLLIGSAAELAIIGKALGKQSVIFFEDDLEEVPLFAKMAGPNASLLVCPTSCSAAKWDHRTLKYPSYHELAYLHPNHFKADKTKVPHSIDVHRPFTIMRFSDLNAYHDLGKSGISDDLALEIIEVLKPYGEVYITSERPLSDTLDQYRISVSPEDIHHVMYYASLFVGDSQTMTAECAVLGTPSIRYNSFVGKLGYLEELEHRFFLTKGVMAGEPQALLTEVKKAAEAMKPGNPVVLNVDQMLSQMMDLNQFLIWFLSTYPQSHQLLKQGKFGFEKFMATTVHTTH